MKNGIKVIASLVITLSAGFVGSLFTKPNIEVWYNNLQKSPYNPPGWVFAPVWIFIYILIGISFYLLWKSDKKYKSTAILLFFLQLILNILWSLAFFGLHNPAAGFADIILLWAVLLICIIKFRKISPAASYLFIPYFFWVSFASYLNFMVVKLN